MKLYICVVLFIFLVGLLIYYNNKTVDESFTINSIDPYVNQQNLDALLNNMPTISQQFIAKLDEIVSSIKGLSQQIPEIVSSIKSSPGSLTITPNPPNSPATTIETIKIYVNNEEINVQELTNVLNTLNAMVDNYKNIINSHISNIRSVDLSM